MLHNGDHDNISFLWCIIFLQQLSMNPIDEVNTLFHNSLFKKKEKERKEIIFHTLFSIWVSM